MKSSQLSVDKVEFVDIKVSTNQKYDGDLSALCQLEYEFKGTRFVRSTNLSYDQNAAEDPRYFIFGIKLNLLQKDQDEDISLPYEVEIHARVYMRYKTDRLQGEERFRAVRATGYGILYGAIREMVSNLTARAQHGIWFLPAADFNPSAAAEAKRDEENRLAKIQKQQASLEEKQPKKRARKVKALQSDE